MRSLKLNSCERKNCLVAQVNVVGVLSEELFETSKNKFQAETKRAETGKFVNALRVGAERSAGSDVMNRAEENKTFSGNFCASRRP